MEFCRICTRELNVIDTRSIDCGGDCLQCMANAGDPDCIAALETKEMTASDMLESIIGSLKGYPYLGGDSRIMAEVDRIVKESRTSSAHTGFEVVRPLGI